MESDDSNLIWSKATVGELLRRLNAKCAEHACHHDIEEAMRYAMIVDCVKNAVKKVGLDKD